MVHEVFPDGAVHKDGRVSPGDLLASVNGVDFKKIKHADAVRTIRAAKEKVGTLAEDDRKNQRDTHGRCRR